MRHLGAAVTSARTPPEAALVRDRFSQVNHAFLIVFARSEKGAPSVWRSLTSCINPFNRKSEGWSAAVRQGSGLRGA